MGSNTLDQITLPKVLDDDDVNQYFTALTGDFLPRNASSGAVETEQHSLGSLTAEWKNLYSKNIFINGVLFNPGNVGSGANSANSIVSGRTRATSNLPDFLRASGSGASMTILATDTPLQITANSISVSIDADIPVTSLTTAPTSQNTCLINDSNLTNQEASKYTGEHESDPLYIDTAGTEITGRVGQYVCLKAATEYMLVFVESATVLRNAFRGFFFDSSGNPIVRETLADNDTLTLMSLGWVFMDSNGTTVDVSYKSPSFSGIEPSSPTTDDYWFDQVNRVWKRYDGSDFQAVNRTLIGLVVIDGTNCIATRSWDFTKVYSDVIECEVEVESNTVVRSKSGRNIVSVYGQQSGYYGGTVRWDITTDLETGLTEANSTVYYLYITEDGVSKISIERPQNREADLRGWYHPYHSWRYVGVAYNDGSGNFIYANSLNSKRPRTDTFTSSSAWLAIPNRDIKATVQGGGGGGGGESAAGSAGGNTTFHTLTGGGGDLGARELAGYQNGGGGGTASGGDINIDGGSGGVSLGSSYSGKGGSSYYAQNANGKTASNSNGSSASGKGGGGSGSKSAGGLEAAPGGGGGGCAIKKFQALSGLFTVTIGAGGSGGSGAGVDGGAGSSGIVEIDYL